jgi:hypothetical protein
MFRIATPIAAVAALAVAVAGCGSSSSNSSSNNSKPVNPAQAENSPPGDIPDNQAFVKFTPPSGGYSVKVPEGWAQTKQGTAVNFTDKLNSIAMDSHAAANAPTVATVRSSELPKLAKTTPGYAAGTVTTVKRKGGKAVRITYNATGKPDPVTGKTRTNAVERYEFFKNGKEVDLVLTGPKGADNVDPWKIVSDSLTWGG